MAAISSRGGWVKQCNAWFSGSLYCSWHKLEVVVEFICIFVRMKTVTVFWQTDPVVTASGGFVKTIAVITTSAFVSMTTCMGKVITMTSHEPHKWWRHDIDTRSVLLGESIDHLITGPFWGESQVYSPNKWPVMRIYNVYWFNSLNNLLNKQSSCWW